MTAAAENVSVVPDSIESIVAYRYWSVSEDGKLLSPVASSASPVAGFSEWPSRQRMEAICPDKKRVMVAGQPTVIEREHPPEQVPNAQCTCGIRGLEVTRAPRWGIIMEHVDAVKTGIEAIGRVSLWGKVISDSEAHRAQFAYPMDIILMSSRHSRMTFPVEAGTVFRSGLLI